MDKRRIMNLIRKLGLLQIDSVNVLNRAHYMPVFSRLGVYDRSLLDHLSWGHRRQRRLFEYWGHEASMIPLKDYPLCRWRMDNARRGEETWKNIARVAREHPRFVADILRQVADRGPLAASDLNEEPRAGSQWWGWSKAKTALEYLFWSGQLAAHTRRGSFERVYDLSERVQGQDLLAQAPPSQAEAQRALLRRAISAMGIATAVELEQMWKQVTAPHRQSGGMSLF